MEWLASYAALTALFVITPGASTALVFRNALAGGRRAGLETASGIALGNSTYAVAAGVGLSSLLATAPNALLAVRMVGACYLLWLGLATIVRVSRAVSQRSAQGQHDVMPGAPKHVSGSVEARMQPPFVEGLVTNLLNPAIPLFYATYVPQFVVPATPFWPRFGMLAVVHVFMALAMHSFYALTVGTASSILAAPRAKRAIEIATGVMLVILALQLLRA